jgi:hypothetical protein
MELMVLSLVLLAAAFALSSASGSQLSYWEGYERHAFTLEGNPCFVVPPAVAAPGKPWVWRTSFPDFHVEVDLELLGHGYHVGFIDCVDMLGADPALDLMDAYYDHVRLEWGLGARPALEAVSRGGLHAYRYAARHPERIACVYADTPLLDLKLWPRDDPDTAHGWADIMKWYGFASEQELLAYRGNPLDLLPIIAKARIPLRHVVSLNDEIVPPAQHTFEARRLLRELGHDMEVVTVAEGNELRGHHFPLPQARESARFIMWHADVLASWEEIANE